MNELKDTSHQPRLPASEEQGLEMPHRTVDVLLEKVNTGLTSNPTVLL